jgi:hypothetical protein
MGAGQIEFEIKKQIYCELKVAVREANKYSEETQGQPPLPLLPKDWGAQVSLSLEVDESSALNPGVTLNTPMASAYSFFGVLYRTPVTVTTPQLFTFGFGGTLSSTATRTDKFDPYYTIAYLSERPPDEFGICNYARPENDPFVARGYRPAKSSPLVEAELGLPLIKSELGLKDWLIGALFTNSAIPSVVGPIPTKEQLKDERLLLGRNGYTSSEITKIVASGASLSESQVLLFKKQGFTNAGIAKLLAAGASPSQLLGLKEEGYNGNEIDAMVAATAKSSGSQQSKSGGGGTSPPDTISIEIKFVIVSNGNVTPTWKLVRVSANTGSAPLFSVGRTRTHDVIITIGPNNQATANTHLASQIGNAVSNGNRSSITPPSTFGF